MNDLNRVVNYTIWANSEWLHFISENRVNDSDLLKRMSHILLSEKVWFQRMEEVDPERDIWQIMKLPQMQELNARHKQSYRHFLNEDLRRLISYKRLTGEEHQSTVSDILMHLMFHGAHHRGQMATSASAIGLKPVNTDFIRFYRGLTEQGE